MTTTTKVIATLIIMAVLGGGALAVLNKNDADTAASPNANTSPSKQSTSEPTSTTNVSETATITFDGSGFSPSTLTVKAGTTVKVINKSNQLLQFDSDPHPEHTDETELNVDMIAAGQSKTFTVTKKGTWGFHDHLDPSLTGTVNVE